MVPWVGSLDAEVAIIGRNPGHDEDAEGIPFCGPGGRVLNDFLGWIGLPRELCYISNTAHCFGGPGDPPPEEKVYLSCVPVFLSKELEILRPKLVITLGNDAMHHVAHREGSCIPAEGDLMKPDPEGPFFICLSHPGWWLRQRRQMIRVREEIAPKVRRRLLDLRIKGLVEPRDLIEELRNV